MQAQIIVRPDRYTKTQSNPRGGGGGWFSLSYKKMTGMLVRPDETLTKLGVAYVLWDLYRACQISTPTKASTGYLNNDGICYFY